MKLKGFKTTEVWDATGLVYGKYWGGGLGTYSSISFQNDSYEGLIAEVNKALVNGSIDSGMGFKNILGALLEITCTTSIEIEENTFVNVVETNEFIGDLTEEQQVFLEECWYER